MARSWEYSPQRRVAMQLAMWTILGLTLALATYVSHHKRQDLSVALGHPTAAGDLNIRLPSGWHYKISRTEEGLLLVEANRPVDGPEERGIPAIAITQQRLSETSITSEDYLLKNVFGASAKTSPIRFIGIKRDGVSAEIEEQGDPSPNAATPGLYAAAVTPLPGGRSLAIVVTVEDAPPFTPADRELLGKIAEGLTLR